MPEDIYSLIWLVIAPAWGLLTGSFLNVCIYRLPRKETIVRGHSYCPTCRHNLGGLDLVPVFSYLLLGRRCRYCRSMISGRYALIEIWAFLYSLLAVAAWRPIRISGLLAAETGNIPSSISPDQAAIALSFAAMLAFFILLVWAMILYDQKRPPMLLYPYLLIPLGLRFLIQPSRITAHLAAVGLVLFLYLLLSLLGLLPTQDKARKLHEIAGLACIGLFGGLQAAQLALLLYLFILPVLAILQGGRAGKQVLHRKESKTYTFILRALPASALLAGSITWLLAA